MRKFNNFTDASKWMAKVIEKGQTNSKKVVAEQVYKDSNEFTYRESGDMYKSGELHSDFKEGIIIERTPYVRRRYYEGGTAGAGNKNAQPRWFDKTVAKYKADYIQIAQNAANKAKEEV